MSSSDSQLAWSRFQPRPEQLDVELLSPARELATLLQRYRDDLDTQRRAGERASADMLAIAVEQAVHVHHLTAMVSRTAAALADAGLSRVHKQLGVLADQMLAALAAGQISIRDPAGAPYHEVADLVHVVGWRHGPAFAAEVVAETIEPVVLHLGYPVRLGRVIMGVPGPEPAEPSPPQPSDPGPGDGAQPT
jgi:hypothetical protein